MTKRTNLANLVTTPVFMRWGYDGGGMACGPVEGSYITEIMFKDDKGRLLFASVSRLMEFVNVYVSEVPLFDLLMHIADSEVDIEYEMKRLEKNSKRFISSELPELENIEKSRYHNEMLLTLLANDYFCQTEKPGDEADWLNKFLKSDKTLEWKSEFWQWEEEEDE